MVPSVPDRRRRDLIPALAGLLALLCLASGHAAAPGRGEPIIYNGNNPHANINGGTLQLDSPELRQAPNTLIRAAKAEASGLAGGSTDNGRWNLTGTVHIEFDGAVLDADTAVVVFADGRIKSIEVHGKPASFSHPAKSAGQRDQGRTETINYDATKREVRFTGHTWYSIGPYEGNTDRLMIYNLDSTELDIPKVGNDDSPVTLTYRPEKRVPTPRTPDRSKAQ